MLRAFLRYILHWFFFYLELVRFLLCLTHELWNFGKLRLIMPWRKGGEGSSVDPPPGKETVSDSDSKQVISRTRTIPDNDFKQVISRTSNKVELLNGKCRDEKGDADLCKRCNDALNKMNDFQRQFLMIGPEGKPNTMMFTEVVYKDAAGNIATKSSFESIKAKEGFFKEKYNKLKRLRDKPYSKGSQL